MKLREEVGEKGESNNKGCRKCDGQLQLSIFPSVYSTTHVPVSPSVL